jgi:hypothetical protein
MSDNKSGQQIGQEYVDKLKGYLDSIKGLPARSGKVNMTAIAEASRVPRQSLYKNDDCRVLLENAVKAKGLLGIEDRGDTDSDKVRLERRITTLEQSNASLVAENYELRRQLKKLKHIEEIVEQGKRVIV